MLAHVVSCFCLFPVVSRSFVPPFSCVEKSLRTFWLTITEGSTQWTITVESLISMIHMHRGKWHWPSLKIPYNGGCGDKRGTDTSSECVRANFLGGVGCASTDDQEVTYSRAERRNTQRESDSKSPHTLGLTSETLVWLTLWAIANDTHGHSQRSRSRFYTISWGSRLPLQLELNNSSAVFELVKAQLYYITSM